MASKTQFIHVSPEKRCPLNLDQTDSHDGYNENSDMTNKSDKSE